MCIPVNSRKQLGFLRILISSLVLHFKYATDAKADVSIKTFSLHRLRSLAAAGNTANHPDSVKSTPLSVTAGVNISLLASGEKLYIAASPYGDHVTGCQGEVFLG